MFLYSLIIFFYFVRSRIISNVWKNCLSDLPIGKSRFVLLTQKQKTVRNLNDGNTCTFF